MIVLRPHQIAFGLVAVLTVVMLNLPRQTAARLKLGLGTLFLPMFGLAAAGQHVATDVGNLLIPRQELLRQNEMLRQENQKLQFELRRTEETEAENKTLRRLLGWQQEQQSKRGWKLKLANVVLHDPANWWRSVQIDAGSRDGVAPNMAVLSPDGSLIGRVASVGLTRAQVTLVGDPGCKVPALVENAAHDTGILGSSGPLTSGTVEMTYLSRNAELKVGQGVLTSGLGGLLPKGISVGRIVDLRTVEYGLGVVAEVKLGANLDALGEVWVLLK